MKTWHTLLMTLFIVFSTMVRAVPLPEHPRPDWERASWMNLNGDWHFAFDPKDAGEGDKWFAADDKTFPLSISVPFPWGSKLSGVEDKADIGWYRRGVTVPAGWKGRRVFLVVGASDRVTTGWIDGKKIGKNIGGYVPFEFEITDYVKWGEEQRLTLRADDKKYPYALYGKQGYGNVRGIWQTVYLEARGETYLDTVHFFPDIVNGSVTAEVTLDAPAKKPLVFSLNFKESDRANPATVSFEPGQSVRRVKIPLREVKLWDLENPYLYEVKASLKGDGVEDEVATYFGMRQISVTRLPGTEIPYVALNGKPIYLQLTLDQSYHPDGYYTFPSDAFMKDEILLSKKLALSGNRIHIKVEVPRKLYWADKLGLLIMADVPNAWGEASPEMFAEHAMTFRRMVKRDMNHPSIFSWILFNETWGLFTNKENTPNDKRKTYMPATQRRVAEAFRAAKQLDPTRLVEDNSPCNHDHVVTDLFTWHAYTTGYNWEKRVSENCRLTFPGSTWNMAKGFVQGRVPMMNSECGNVWGYRGSTGDCDWSWDYHMMINAFRRHLQCGGWLYTEHHDVCNEWNGYVRFDRTPKFTGIEDLFPGSSLLDWHADAYLPLDTELCRAFPAGATWTMPVDISFTTDKHAGKEMSLSFRLRYLNGTGRLVETEETAVGRFTAASWQNGRVADAPVKLPNETAAGVVCFTMKDPDGKIVARNFACFVTRGASEPSAVSVKPADFKKAEWSQKQWNVLDGLKVNGAGTGFFEYAFAVPNGTGTKSALFRAEISAKRLNGKDIADAKKDPNIDIDCMLGGGHHDPSKNSNSYPMTDTVLWSGAVKVYADGTLIKTVALPDDPADHRGILSWFSQLKNGTLCEAGSYGYLVEAEIPADILSKVKGGTVTIRLEAERKGLAVYGASFGRYPFDPTVWF